MDWFLYDNGLRHERVKLALCIIRVGFDDLFKRYLYPLHRLRIEVPIFPA